MVVISIIGILSAVLYANFGDSSAASRDAQRQGDLRTLQTAIELYKNRNGVYPAGCNASGTWSGQIGTAYACGSGSNIYIVNIAPEYIPTLPKDPKLNGSNSGYVYTVNTEGTVYKLMAKNTVESEVVDYSHPFKSCDASNIISVGMCNTTLPSNNLPAWCSESNAQFKTSYGVWGGYITPTVSPSNGNYNNLIERYTEDIICDIQ